MRVDRSTKSDVQSVLCYCFNNGHNHPSSAVKVIKAFTGIICYTSDVVWTVPRAPAIAGKSLYAAAQATLVFNISDVPPPPPIHSSELQPLPLSLQPPPPPLPPSQS